MRAFNAVLPYDELCDSNERTKAEECTGKIPAGQQHYEWIGAYRSDPRDSRFPTDVKEQYLRFCVHCVRDSNWRLTYDKGTKPILLKVQLTYDDGSVHTLEGDAADDWEYSINGSLVMSAVHGMESQPSPWKVTKPDENKS